MECLGCRELLKQQDAQRIKDAKRQKTLDSGHEKHPQFAPRVITGHRRWLVQPRPPTGQEVS